jgi:hypothetical protein
MNFDSMQPVTAGQGPFGRTTRTTGERLLRMEPTALVGAANAAGVRSGDADPVSLCRPRVRCGVHIDLKSTRRAASDLRLFANH